MKAGEEDFSPLEKHPIFNKTLASDIPKFEFAQRMYPAFE